jgi:HPt (histidine-containing phosphotransfer) domain-containing protein
MADIIGAMYIFLDTARASDFATDNGQMLNLADTFVSSLQNDLQALQNARTESDTTELQRLLHTLKGYVTFLCTQTLANELIDIEAKARQSNADQLNTMVDALLPSLNKMQQELTDWRERLSKS